MFKVLLFALALAMLSAHASVLKVVTGAANAKVGSYTKAKNRCLVLGCVLAKINNAAENTDAINQIIAHPVFPAQTAWFGLDDLSALDVYKWVEDGTTLGGSDFQDWCAPGYPPSNLFPDNP